MKYGVGSEREPVSLWQVVIPADVEREVFVEQCINTNTISISNQVGEVRSWVICGDLALQQLEFPPDGRLGSTVIVGNVQTDGGEKLVVLDIVRTRDKLFNNQENAYRFQKVTETGEAEITIRGKRGDIYMSVNSSEEDGGNVVLDITNAEGAGRLEVNVNGNATIVAKNIVQVASEAIVEEVTIPSDDDNAEGYKTTFTKTLTGFQVDMIKEEDELVTTLKYEMGVGFSYLDEFENNIEINEEVISIISASKVVNLGDGAEQMVLGNVLATLLTDLITEISIATTPSGPLGNAAAIAAYVADVQDILSTYGHIEANEEE